MADTLHFQDRESASRISDQCEVGPDAHQSVYTLGHRWAAIETDAGDRKPRYAFRLIGNSAEENSSKQIKYAPSNYFSK